MARVLFVDQFARMGGGQRILLDVVEYFAAHGQTCQVALPEAGPLVALLEERWIKTGRFTLPELRSGYKGLRDQLAYIPAVLTARKEMTKLASDFGADLIFCNGPRATLPCVLAAQSLGIPLVCAVHLIFSGRERALLSWCFRNPAVRAVTFCSQVAAASFPDLAAEKRMFVGDWVSPQFLSSPHHNSAKALFGLREEGVSLGVVGRLSKNKGQGFFLEAMAPLVHERQDIELVIAGSSDFEDPREEERLRSLAAELGTSDQTRFLGTVQNTVALMDALDMLVVPSLWDEPFGLVAVEGMARGLPVVATRSGGLVDIVENEVTGLLVARELDDLRAAISRLLNNPVLSKEMGEAAKARAVAVFSAGPRLEELLNMAEKLVGSLRAA